MPLFPPEHATRSDHVCACQNCDPSIAVLPEYQGENHISVRFWDSTEDRTVLRRAKILLNGEPIEGVFEAILGEEGTLWRYRGVPSASMHLKHQCLTCMDRQRSMGLSRGDAIPMPYVVVCTEKLTGRVELRQDKREEDQG